MRLQGWNVSGALLTNDGGTLITIHQEMNGRTLRGWDVGGSKPMRWAFGIPVGVGVLLLALVKGYRRVRAMKRPETNQVSQEKPPESAVA